jgi:exodeoxyribonuclease VII small subunit
MTGGGDLSALSFEQLVEALESITRQMAAGDIGIEAVADLYEEAGRLHAEASDRLDGVRRRIEGLASGGDGDGAGDGDGGGGGPGDSARGGGHSLA